MVVPRTRAFQVSQFLTAVPRACTVEGADGRAARWR